MPTSGPASTTIRVRLDQRDHLRRLAATRGASMADTLDAALEALRRSEFHRGMADAERALREDPEAWADYQRERDAWLLPDASAGQTDS